MDFYKVKHLTLLKFELGTTFKFGAKEKVQKS